ncbi:hydrogenase expression/formation protein HypE [uncultured Roseivirga sp.]|uniref:hydrogenase expression/formation protein HypE n=1 Tax=uncultured Roseivirga sp. TaxID=543088 RepID=UPI002587BC5F|nr:hydrogenase expression/formation protein HypE [uncultured Roseivirga sp.]|tara:strand:- start:1323 stop:2366 length:1044 start_codon:yes stop_codon:yes gene_type:complete
MKMELSCPMPKLDFDLITLGHGSGGILTHKLLDAGVFDLLKNDKLSEQHDGAILQLSGESAFTTDSFVINPIFFPGGNIGELAVYGTVNDLAMCGAIPKYLSLSFILEEGLSMEEFWKILVSIKGAAESAGVQIVTGDTKVVDKGKGDKIFINTTGIGSVHPKSNISINNIKAGDCIVVSDQLARHGIAIMSVRSGLEFETDIESDTKDLSKATLSALEKFGSDIHVLRDATRGGVATVLKEMAEKRNLGMDLEYKQIPVNESVQGACEMLGLDPMYVANEGVFVSIVSNEIAQEYVDFLKRDEATSSASIIGTVTDKHPKQVIMTSAIGGKRALTMLPGEQLPRIC